MEKNIFNKNGYFTKEPVIKNLYSVAENEEEKKCDEKYERLKGKLGEEKISEIVQKFAAGRDIEKIKIVYRLTQDDYETIARNAFSTEVRKKRKDFLDQSFTHKIGFLGSEFDPKPKENLTALQARKNLRDAIKLVEGTDDDLKSY